jgi:hypothetical protein
MASQEVSKAIVVGKFVLSTLVGGLGNFGFEMVELFPGGRPGAPPVNRGGMCRGVVFCTSVA